MKALIIGGGLPQIELIHQLKKRRIKAYVADIIPDAITRPFCDKYFIVRRGCMNDLENIVRQEHIDFLIAVCADQVILDVAYVAEKFGLPWYLDYKTTQDVSDKTRMKRIFKEHDIPTTDFVATSSFNMDIFSHLSFPLIVKPVDAFSSKGVRKADNATELKQYYEEAHNISRTGGVIVEEYFQGEEISVDAFVLNGKVTILSITNSEKVKDKDRFIIFRGRYPASVPKSILLQIENVAQEIATAFGLVNAPLLIQLLHNGDKISVLEFCARTGGNMKFLLIKYSSGVDVIGATIDIVLGNTPDITIKNTGNNIVVNDFIYCHPGIFDHFEGFEELERDGTINEFHPVRAKGTEIKGVTSSSDRIAGMNILADTIEQYNNKLKIINQSVKVVDINGNDIMRHDLLPQMK